MAESSNTITCKVCGSANTQLVFTAKDRNREVDEREFRVMRCTSCGVGFTLPMLSVSELSRYYPREYYSIETNMKLEEGGRRYCQTRVDRIRRFIRQGKLLDIGAGTGMFLKTARENGFDVEGLEISADAASFGKSTWGLTIRKGNLHEISLPADSYDVVTLGHVYEHLHEPHEVAKQLHAILRRGGLLVVAVPNFDSLQAKLFRSRWFHLDVPRHLFHYAPSGVKSLIEQEGFKVVEVSFFSSEHNWGGIVGSVMKLNRPGESLLHKASRKTIATWVAKGLAFLEAALGRGGTFEIYAIKQ